MTLIIIKDPTDNHPVKSPERFKLRVFKARKFFLYWKTSQLIGSFPDTLENVLALFILYNST